MKSSQKQIFNNTKTNKTVMLTNTLLKRILYGVGGIILMIFAIKMNPWDYNDPTERTVVTQMSGYQFVQFGSGVYYSGFFAKSQSYPNQLSVSYGDTTWDGDLSLRDNVVEIGTVKVRFNDATEAYVAGIVQYILPSTQKEMLLIHNAHRTPSALVQRRLAPYTKECLQSSSQLMSSEMHYSGGRAQMTQDYFDQLKNGTFLLSISEKQVFDTIDNTSKRIYVVNIQRDKNGSYLRKFSSIKEYSINLGDAQITNVEYSGQVREMLKKKIDAATQASISKQNLMTAEQQKLTAKAEGEKELTRIEYEQKQEQTKQVVAAQTLVEVAKQDLIKQDIALQASIKEAQKIKTLADAAAYEKQRIMQADGALEKKLNTYMEVQKYWADAFSKYTGNIVPLYQSGSIGGSGNAMQQFMEMQNAKAMKDLNLNMKNE